MSSLSSSSLAQREAFQDSELLERIILFINDGKTILKLQRVSRKWRDTINRSTKLQRRLFFLSTPASPTTQPRDKNLMIAFIAGNFFSTKFSSQGTLLKRDIGYSVVSMWAPPPCMTLPLKQAWLAPNASWKKMQISNPPITKIRWQVRLPSAPEFHRGLPIVMAEFEFPNGLTMEDLYNLILGTEGFHVIIWPEKWKADLVLTKKPSANYCRAFVVNELWAAIHDDALLIIQVVHAKPTTLGTVNTSEEIPRKSVWTPVDLFRYEANLTKLEVQELTFNPDTGARSWEYLDHSTDDASAMEIFLEAAAGSDDSDDSDDMDYME
ncbi:hypothetical protein F4805DRAFT_472843 [Annulohypoxylon moriforme]|nr:hypothetical protein F4805DRAFT_472843 [Annulohypoxylon moriforme]